MHYRDLYCIFCVGTCVVCALVCAFKETHNEKNKVFVPSNIYQFLRRVNSDLLNHKQQDAHEFWLRLMTAICNERNCYSTLGNLFEHVVITSVTCQKCNKESRTEREYHGHVVEIHERSTVTEAVMAYMEEETIQGYYCENCNDHECGATKKFIFENAPKILHLTLNRFKNSQKIISDIQLNLSLNLLVKDRKTPAKYKLATVINHIGTNPFQGHYTAVSCSSGDQFYEFDDTYVRKVGHVDGRNSYILMYQLSEVFF